MPDAPTEAYKQAINMIIDAKVQPDRKVVPGPPKDRHRLPEPPQAPNLGKRFRRLTRELMCDETIYKLVRQRVIDELTGAPGFDGEPTPMKLTPVLCKIAGGQYYMKREEGPQFVGPAIHVHLNQLTEQELDDYVQRGIRPARLKVLEAATVREREEEG